MKPWPGLPWRESVFSLFIRYLSQNKTFFSKSPYKMKHGLWLNKQTSLWKHRNACSSCLQLKVSSWTTGLSSKIIPSGKKSAWSSHLVARVQGSGHDLISVTLIWTRTTTLQAWLDSVTSWKPLQIQNKWQATQQKILWRPVLNGNAYMQPTAWEHQRTLTWTTHRHTQATADQLTSHVARLEDSNTRPSWGQRKHLPPANTTRSRPCTSVNGSVFSMSQCRVNGFHH